VLVRVDTGDSREAHRIPLGFDYVGIAVTVDLSPDHDTVALLCPYLAETGCSGYPRARRATASSPTAATGRSPSASGRYSATEARPPTA